MIIICGISALEYWRTPPLIRDAEITRELAQSIPGYRELLEPETPRSNASRVEAIIGNRLLTDLKNLTLPIHVMVDSSSCRRSSGLVTLHRRPDNLPSDQLVDLGNGAWIPSPALMLLLGFPGWGTPAMALAMLESCGSYALFDPSPLAEIVQKELLSHQVISAHMADGDHRIREFYDASGKRTPFVDDEGDELPWQAVFSPRSDTVTDMWRRPPLTSRMELQELEAKLGRIWGSSAARAAVPMVLDGSASPLESRCAALLFSPVACGGEGWEAPYLNRRIDWSSQAAKLVDTSYCIADALWPDKNSILEINGEEYHTDADGFKTASGRTPALESMGYRVVEITHAQLSDLEQLDQMLTVISRRLDLPLCERTTIWLKRRSTLHEGLFSQCSY